MVKRPTTKPEDTVTETGPDPRPEDITDGLDNVDDVVDEDVIASPDQGTDKDAGEIEKPVLERADDPRDRIFANHEAKRAREAEAGTDDDEDEDGGTDDGADATASADTAISGEQMHTVIVDGEQQQVPLSTLIAGYQKNQAADQRLDKTTKLLEQVQEIRDGLEETRRTKDETADQAGATSSATDTATREEQDAQLASIVEKIQMGDPEEAAAALQQFGDGLQTNMQTTDGVTKIVNSAVESTMAQREDRAASTKAKEQFAKDYKDINDDENLQPVFVSNLVREARTDLVNAGVPENDLAKVQNTARLLDIHRRFRVEGFEGIRPVSALMTSAGDQTREWVKGLRGGGSDDPDQTPAKDDTTRKGRKADLVTQPSTSAVRRAEKPQEKPQSRKDAFKEIKKARGQPIAP